MEERKVVYMLGGGTKIWYNATTHKYEATKGLTDIKDHIIGFYRSLEDALACVSY